jgi:D-3-phosphoglycerate dehydrogenase
VTAKFHDKLYGRKKQKMKYKYTCLNPIAACGLNNLDDKYERTENLQDANAAFVRSAKMDELEVGGDLLAVARAGAGVNNIPHADYAKKGIVVFNTPGANANGVKELVIAGMLLASRDIVGGIDWVKENAADPAVGKAAEKAKKAFAGTEIAGKKLGVIGLGAIGQKVANAATSLGMEVYGYDPYLSVEAAWNLCRSVKHCKDVETIYQTCDFITIHVPALESTKGMINAETIAMMKTGVIIINAARDALVNEKDMLAALESGKVRK